MTRKTPAHSDRPHTGNGDYNEGPVAAARFRAAIGHLATLPKSAVNGHVPTTRKPRKKK
jgi:hypothetical protein